MTDISPGAGVARFRLLSEFLLFFVVTPIVIATAVGRFPLFPVLIGFTGLALILLQLTTGWRWKMLLRGPVFGEWRIILIFGVITALASFALVMLLVPERLLELPTHRPKLWLLIMLLYPVLSALPQEIIYRTLFFERYGALFPNASLAIAANGAAFAMGHLFFSNWVTIVMTGFGGAIMGWAYMRSRAVGLPLVLHALAGQILFTAGLGVYFYHGAIGSAP